LEAFDFFIFNINISGLLHAPSIKKIKAKICVVRVHKCNGGKSVLKMHTNKGIEK